MNSDHSKLILRARELVERTDPATVGMWPRATAFLARRALEGALDSLWRLRAPGLELCSAKAQFICLPAYLHGHRELAERASYAWFGLSRSCHQHPYELSPTSPELLGWIGTVEDVIASVHSICTAKQQ